MDETLAILVGIRDDYWKKVILFNLNKQIKYVSLLQFSW